MKSPKTKKTGISITRSQVGTRQVPLGPLVTYGNNTILLLVPALIITYYIY